MNDGRPTSSSANPTNPPAISEARATTPLGTSFTWTVVGNIVYQACLFGVTIVIAKFDGSDTLGRWSMAVAISSPLFIFAGLNAGILQANDPNYDFSFGNYLGLRLLMVGLGMVILLGATTCIDSAHANSTLLVLTGMAKGIESISGVFYAELQRHERMRPIAISMMLKGGLSLIAFLVGLEIGGIEVAALLLVLAWVAALFAYDLPQAFATHGVRLGALHFDRIALARLFVRALPLGIASFLIALTTSLPRVFVEREHGYAELGIFSALAYLMSPGAIVVNALGLSTTPRLARLFADRNREEFLGLFVKLMLLAFALAIAGVLVAMVVGGPVLRILFRPEFAEHLDLLVWLMVAAGLGYLGSIVGYTMTAARVLRSQVPLFVVVCGATALGCWLWTGPFGLVGAAWALILAGLVQLCGSAALLIFGLRSGQFAQRREVGERIR
jgi:O-antigen/teichoic acid export membrane protein